MWIITIMRTCGGEQGGYYTWIDHNMWPYWVRKIQRAPLNAVLYNVNLTHIWTLQRRSVLSPSYHSWEEVVRSNVYHSLLSVTLTQRQTAQEKKKVLILIASATWSMIAIYEHLSYSYSNKPAVPSTSAPFLLLPSLPISQPAIIHHLWGAHLTIKR